MVASSFESQAYAHFWRHFRGEVSTITCEALAIVPLLRVRREQENIHHLASERDPDHAVIRSAHGIHPQLSRGWESRDLSP